MKEHTCKRTQKQNIQGLSTWLSINLFISFSSPPAPRFSHRIGCFYGRGSGRVHTASVDLAVLVTILASARIT